MIYDILSVNKFLNNYVIKFKETEILFLVLLFNITSNTTIS